jgi:predicted Zn-dependent peptidase
MYPGIRRHEDRLENGLRVITVELPHLHTATVILYAKVGSRFESPEESGLSHFVEHMLYRGTERYPSSYHINFAFESLGGTLYAETGRDYSSFQVTLDPSLVDNGLELFGELFARPLFADIELERELILEELCEDYDERGVEINSGDIARGLLFGSHPLSQRIIGPRANVERFSEAEVRRHFERYYCAENVLLCVAGPVAAEQVRRQAAQHLGVLARGSPAHEEPHYSDQLTPHYKYVPDSGSQTSVTVLWRSIAERHPQYLASVALVRALDDGMSTPLHYRLCDQLGLAYSVGASLEPLHDVSLFEVVGSAANAKVARLLAELFGLVRGFCREPIGEAELAKIKRRYCYDLAASADDAIAMANWYGGTALYYPPLSLEEQGARLQGITAAEIQRVAEHVFRPENLTVTVVGSLTKARQAEVRAAVES